MFDQIKNRKELSGQILSLLKTADEKINKKDYDSALKLIEQALKKSPDDPYLIFRKGTICFLKGDFHDACSLIMQVAAVNSDHAPYFSLLASILFNLDRYEEAGLNIDKALAIDPDDPVAKDIKAALQGIEKAFSAGVAVVRRTADESVSLPSGDNETVRICSVSITRNLNYRIAVGADDPDPISKALSAQSFYLFPKQFLMVLSLLRPGNIVLDLGAHIGTFSLAAAALGCTVISVEASPRNYGLLKLSALKNNFRNVTIIHSAVCDHSGTIEFVEDGTAGTIRNPFVKSKKAVTVQATTGDELVKSLQLDHVDLIKMDIEGAEISAVQGMRSLLSSAAAPLICYESNGHTLNFFNRTPQELLSALEDLGYRNYRAVLDRPAAATSHDFQPECVLDYIAVKGNLPDLLKKGNSSPLSAEEMISLIIAESSHPSSDHRTYVARALRTAGKGILSDQRIIETLQRLSKDDSPAVRQAISWYAK